MNLAPAASAKNTNIAVSESPHRPLLDRSVRSQPPRFACHTTGRVRPLTDLGEIRSGNTGPTVLHYDRNSVETRLARPGGYTLG
jgi:hypothetical protein